MEFRHLFRNESGIKTDYFYSAPHVSIPYLSILSVSCLFGTIGNLLVMWAVCKVKPLKTTGNIFIVNLALADLCVTAIVDPFAAIGMVKGEEWFVNEGVLCEVIASLCLTSCFCSLLSIGAISINRYVHICHYGRYSRIYTKQNTVLICVLLWVISFLFELPNFVGWGDHIYDKKTLMCAWDRKADYSYTLFFVIVGIVSPFLLIIICYMKIFLYFRASKKRVLQRNCSQADKNQMKQINESMKLAHTLFAIFVVFACCWTPYAIIILADRHDTWPEEPHLFSVLLAHSNSSFNCLVYGLMNSNFRKGYVMLLSLNRFKRHESQQRLNCCDDEEVFELAISKTRETSKLNGNK